MKFVLVQKKVYKILLNLFIKIEVVAKMLAISGAFINLHKEICPV